MGTQAEGEKDGRAAPRESAGPPPSELTKFLLLHRESLQPEHAGLKRHEGRGRSARGLTQRQVARLADRMDPASYGKFERDELREVTDEQIDAIARALQMDTTDRDILFVLAKGKYPPMRPGDSRDPNNHLREFVEEMDAWERPGKNGIILGPLAFTTDPFYYVTACNEGFASLFKKGDLPANVLTWGLLGGDGRLLNHDHYLLSAARVRVAVLERTYGDDPRFRVIDELLRSLPPSDTLSDHLTKGLQEDIFPYWPPGYTAGSIRSSEMHIAGVGGLTDWSRLFIMDFWENVEPDELREMSSSERKPVPRKRIHRLPGTRTAPSGPMDTAAPRPDNTFRSTS